MDYDLALRNSDGKQTDSEYIDSIICDYLKLDALGSFGRVASERCRLELLKHAKTGRFGFGGEKASQINENATPCEALWKRMKEIRHR